MLFGCLPLGYRIYSNIYCYVDVNRKNRHDLKDMSIAEKRNEIINISIHQELAAHHISLIPHTLVEYGELFFML